YPCRRESDRGVGCNRGGRVPVARGPRASGAVLPRAADASEHVPGAPCFGGAARRSVHETGKPRHQRRVQAPRVGARLPGRARAKRELLGQWFDSDRSRPPSLRHGACCRTESLSRRRTSYHQQRAAGGVRAYARNAPRRASRRPVPERLLLRLQSYEAAVQGQPGAAAGSLVGNRPRSADGERHGTRRDAGLELGAARCSQLRGTALSVLDDESRGTRVCGAARVSTVGLRRGQTAHHRNPLQHIRYAPAHRAGHPVDVARRAGSGGNAGKRGVPGVVVEHAGEGGDAGIPFELARRLQRRKYIPPGNAFRCSVEPHRLRQRRIRCTGFQSCHADGPGRTPAVHAGSRKPSARGSSRHTDLLFREQAPGQSARRWLGIHCPGLSLQSAPEPFTRIKITGLPMLRFALLRILSAIPTLFLVVVLAFLMVHAAPGGPFDQERVLPPENARNLAAAYHLDEPLPRQFGRYVSGLVRGDLGPSYYYRDHSVSDLIGAALPKSLQLGLLSMALALLVGISAGTTAALKRDTLLDRFVTGFSMTGISVPVFVIAPLLVLVFAVQLRWLPASWSGSAGFDRLLLPVLALSLPQIAY